MPVQPTVPDRKAVVLLSGGLDSATVLYIAKAEGYHCYVLSFDYGQRHRRELESARWIALQTSSPLQLLSFSLPWKGSALLDKTQSIPKGRSLQEMNREIPATYVPARNTIFLSFAASWAEAIGASTIYIGANALDFSGYPDCRPDYFAAFNRMIEKGTREREKPIELVAPLVSKTKAEIIQWGHRLGVPYEWTWSCYEGEDFPCGACDSCLLRAKGFKDAGIEDPLLRKSEKLP